MSLQYLQRRRIRLAYERRGNGPLVALVQGLGMPGRMWLDLAESLLRRGFTVVVPDNRGTGSSDCPPPPYWMRDFAKDLAAILREVGKGPALVVGVSFGGMVAQHLALRHPALVSGMVLAATTCGPPVGKLPRLGFLAPLFRTLLGHRGSVAALRRYLVSRQSLERDPRLFAEWDRQLALQPIRWKGLLGQLCAAATHSTGLGLGRIRCPVEVVTGDGDRIISPANSRILARRIPGATLTILPGLGHAFPLEDPRALPLAVLRVHERSLQEARPVAAAPKAGQ